MNRFTGFQACDRKNAPSPTETDFSSSNDFCAEIVWASGESNPFVDEDSSGHGYVEGFGGGTLC